MALHNANKLFETKKVRAIWDGKEVRAAWDDTGNRWLFSVVDVIAVLTESKNPRNYWKVMKHRLAKEKNELVTRCNQLKLVAADGKRYLADCLPQNEMLNLVEVTPSQHAVAFARWLITGENQLGSKSRDKAYQLWKAMAEAHVFGLTGRINDREMFMKGIDYSYYYEQND